MISGNTKFKSKFTDKEIFTEIVNRMNDYKLKDLLNNDLLLRTKCKIFNKKDKTYDREKVVTSVIDLVSNNKNIRQFIMLDLDGKVERMKLNKTINKLKTLEEWDKYIYNDNFNSDIFLIIVALWINHDKELNEFGDNLFKKYLEGAFKSQEDLENVEDMDEDEFDEEFTEMEELKMDDNILSMNLGECIKKLSSYEEKISNLENRLNEKDKEIEALKVKLKLSEENKEIKKELKDINKFLANDNKNKEIENINSNITKLNIKNLEVEKIFKTKLKDSFASQENSILKNINQLLVDQQNVFKSTSKVYNDELFEKMKKYMDEKIKENVKMVDSSHKSNPVPEIINTSDKKIKDNSSIEPVKDPHTINPLIDILDGIKLNNMK